MPAIPTFAYKYIATAIGSVLIAGSIWGGIKWHAKSNFDKGVAYEVAEQAKRDALVPPIQDDLENDIEDAKDKRNDTTREIRTEVRTGISEVHLAKATADAKQTGRELGRAETIAAYRANRDACLNVDFADDDQLLLDGWDQQRDIFGDVIRGDGASKTD